MSHLLLGIKAEVAKTSQHALALAPERIAHFQHRYLEIIKEGSRRQSSANTICAQTKGTDETIPPKKVKLSRLDKHKIEVLAHLIHV